MLLPDGLETELVELWLGDSRGEESPEVMEVNVSSLSPDLPVNEGFDLQCIGPGRVLIGSHL